MEDQLPAGVEIVTGKKNTTPSAALLLDIVVLSSPAVVDTFASSMICSSSVPSQTRTTDSPSSQAALNDKDIGDPRNDLTSCMSGDAPLNGNRVAYRSRGITLWLKTRLLCLGG